MITRILYCFAKVIAAPGLAVLIGLAPVKAQEAGLPFRRGDAEQDGVLGIADAILGLEQLFLGKEIECADASDSNDDGALDVSDPIYTLIYMFRGGTAPPDPFPDCGVDPTGDGLFCNTYLTCNFPRYVTNSNGMRFLYIPPGEFVMGSPSHERGRESDEKPHRVQITCGYYFSETEVTQKQYLDIIGKNPSFYNGGKYGEFLDRPVESVSWKDAQHFSRKLSEREGVRYRLPTEAEWEYACRAGMKTRFWFGDALECNDVFCDPLKGCDFLTFEAGCQIWDIFPFALLPVAQKQPNPWGLFDMHGNAVEWCLDWFGPYPDGVAIDPRGPTDGIYKVIRGNAINTIENGRSAERNRFNPLEPHRLFGFRVVQEICHLFSSTN